MRIHISMAETSMVWMREARRFFTFSFRVIRAYTMEAKAPTPAASVGVAIPA